MTRIADNKVLAFQV